MPITYTVDYTGPQRESLIPKKPKDKVTKSGISAVTHVMKGGPGSGNHGHSGRPGQVGGSGGGGGSAKGGKPSRAERRNNQKRAVGKGKAQLGKAKKALKGENNKKAHAALKEAAGHAKDALHGLAGKADTEGKQKAVHQGLAHVKEAEGHLSGHSGEGHEHSEHLKLAGEHLGEAFKRLLEETHRTLLERE
jgi:hypothetical protein